MRERAWVGVMLFGATSCGGLVDFRDDGDVDGSSSTAVAAVSSVGAGGGDAAGQTVTVGGQVSASVGGDPQGGNGGAGGDPDAAAYEAACEDLTARANAMGEELGCPAPPAHNAPWGPCPGMHSSGGDEGWSGPCRTAWLPVVECYLETAETADCFCEGGIIECSYYVACQALYEPPPGCAEPAAPNCGPGLPACGTSSYCDLADDRCGAGETRGLCRPLPMESCTSPWGPACGCDGAVYDNLCDALRAGVDIDAAGLACGDAPVPPRGP